MRARQRYEASGGYVALAFILTFFSLVALMAYAGVRQEAAERSECETKGGEYVWRPHSESLCLPKGQVIPLSIR